VTALPVPSTHFVVPDDLTAAEPPEHRGLSRDGVRLLVLAGQDVTHSRFAHLDEFLRPGDVVVVNTSQTLAAEVDGVQNGNWPTVVHVATELDDGSWVIELRTAPDGARPILHAQPGEVIRLEDSVRIRLLEPYPGPKASPTGRGSRLWRAQVISSRPFPEYLATYGRPISYGYLSAHWPLSDYQTIFSVHPGSAEMPSAARPFTPELIARLIARGIAIAPIILHTGVSSQDAGEPPQPERFSVSESTAGLINSTRAAGNRVVAVGTTVTRAVESAVDFDWQVRAIAGWTELVLGPQRPVRVVTGLVTGLHNPDASHLLLVESVVGADLAQRAYDAAIAERYLWHEFGDSCLLLPPT
jgi:S-adenosylmethionine:tRNA ribosyltransferase-isomerase